MTWGGSLVYVLYLYMRNMQTQGVVNESQWKSTLRGTWTPHGKVGDLLSELKISRDLGRGGREPADIPMCSSTTWHGAHQDGW